MNCSFLKITLTVAAAGLLTIPTAWSQGVTASTTNTTTTTTTAAGTISELSPDTLVVRTETDPTPIRYTYTRNTTYVDETGAPVSLELVKSGLPVTVHYVRQGDRMIANRVVVRRQTTTTTTPAPAPAPTVIERNTTVTQPPVVIEKPVVVEKKVPVYVDRPVDRPVIIEKKVPVPVAPPPVIEKKTTTTTTTTTDRKKDD